MVAEGFRDCYIFMAHHDSDLSFSTAGSDRRCLVAAGRASTLYLSVGAVCAPQQTAQPYFSLCDCIFYTPL